MSAPSIIRHKRGDTFELRIKLTNLEGAVEVLGSGYEIHMQMRKGVDKELIFDFATDGTITKLGDLDAAGNNLIIKADSADTKRWPVGRFPTDIEVRIDDAAYTVPGPDEPQLVLEVVGDITQ